MKRPVRITFVVMIMVFFLLVAAAVYYYAFIPSEGEPETATLTEFFGQVQVMAVPESEWAAPVAGSSIQAGGQLATGEDGRARLDLSSGTVVRVGPSSYFNMISMANTDEGLAARVRLGFGQIWIILRGGSLDVDTAVGVASIRGSYMSVAVTESGQVYVTCLEGDCQLQTEAGTVMLVAGQTAAVSSASELPVRDVMTDEQVMEWLDVNPEATMIIPAVTATAAAGLPDVPLPPLACLQDNSCHIYCAPIGWDAGSGTLPSLDQVPQGCLNAVYALMWQGVDPILFVNCVALGGDPQICANTSLRPVLPLPNDGSISVSLPPMACLRNNSCAAFCKPVGYVLNSGEKPPFASIPPDCLETAKSLAFQGVDPWLFIECVIHEGDPQVCANSSVVR